MLCRRSINRLSTVVGGWKTEKKEETSKPGTVFNVYFGVNSSPPAGSPSSKWTNFSFTAIHFRNGSCFAVPYLLPKGPQPPHLQSSLEKSRKVSVSRRSVCGHMTETGEEGIVGGNRCLSNGGVKAFKADTVFLYQPLHSLHFTL